MLLSALDVRLIVLAGLVGLVWQPSPAQAAAATKTADTPLGHCIADNRQALEELNAELAAARRREVLNPVGVARLQGLQAQLDKLRGARDPRTLVDCEAATQVLAEQAERLQRRKGAAQAPAASSPAAPAPAAARAPTPVAAPAPASAPAATLAQTRACLTTQANAFNDMARRFNGLTEPGRMAQDRLTELQKLGERLAQMQRILATPGTPAFDCVRTGAEMAAARAELDRLASGN